MFTLDETNRMVEKMVRGWCEQKLAPRLPALEAGAEMPWALMRDLATTFGVAALAEAAARKRIAKLRATDGAVEEREGGGTFGGDPMMMAVFVKELSRVSPGFAMGWGVSVGLAGGAIVGKGTPEQIERWGVPLVTCKQIGSWCLTEPGAGSDAFGSMATTATPCAEGYRLHGSKTFITNGPGAEVFIVYARIDRGEPREQQGLGTFILDRGMPGLTTGTPFKKMGMRDSPTCEVFLDDVVAGPERLLGGREKGAAGRSDTKDSLGTERSGIPAMAWGILERCYDQSVAYVRERRQFGRPIGAFQAVQLKIADLYLKLKTVENVVYRLAWMQKSRTADPAFVNASKALCSQLAVDGALTAIQLHGGYGYMEEYHLEKLARDSKLLELGAGTTDINLLSAARSLIGPESLE
ncbi:MAG: acyl-CoA dehydrogenase family protein [Myxococcales bacterium]|nr:acyl-CoA dehydrogenase family protein [Myxococcales bacterium]